jgi:hypothetical protein
MMRYLLLSVLLVLLWGCSEEKQSDLAGSVSGPGITVHCAAALPKSVGDTTTTVNCPPAL